MSSSEFHFQVDHIRFQKVDTGWCVLGVRALSEKAAKTVAVTGVFAQIEEGMVLRSQGAWKEHPTFGRQWVSESYVEADPTDQPTMVKFLHGVIFKDIKGVGKKAAEKVVTRFKDRTLSVLDDTPEELLKIKGFSKKRIKEISEVWQNHRHSRHVILHLCAHGIHLSKARKVLKARPHDTLRSLKEDPYGLIDEIPGFGFLTVDGLYLALGGNQRSPRRVAAAICYLLKRARDQDGHSFLGKGQIQEKLPTLLSLEPEAFSDIAAEAFESLRSRDEVVMLDGFFKKEGDFVLRSSVTAVEPSWRPVTLCYISSLYRCEQAVAELFRALAESGKRKLSREKLEQWVKEAEKLWGQDLSEEQKTGVYQGLCEPVSILTGGAGVGKTTALKAVLFLAERLDMRVALASPTGRAAQRMKEVTGEPSQTLHRLLEWSPEEGVFLRSETRPLTFDLVIVDEASMIDLYLARSLLVALSSRTQLMLIGDPHQLPSVSVGCVLKDTIESKVIPHTTLTAIFRQAASSPIIQAASEVREYKPPSCFKNPYKHNSDVENLVLGEDRVLYIPASHFGQIQEHIISTITKTLSHLDPLKEIQVLTPMNKGPLGCDVLNSKLQTLFHPGKTSQDPGAKEQRVFFKGDKVIQTMNDYDLSVFNGDIGVVDYVQKNKSGRVIGLEVSFPTHQDSRKVSFAEDHLVNLKLAYAITIHKSQGSEFPAVIMPLSPSHHIMLSKNLIYTAITRARHVVVIIGEAYALERALHKPAAPPRFSRLRQLIAEGGI